MPCESIFWFRIPKRRWCYPALELLRLWKLRGKNQSIKTRLIDEDRLALVVRTRVLNQHSGFTKLVVGTHTQASLPHPYPRTKVHCLSPLSSLHRSSNPYHGLISLQYTERTWNGPETEVERTCRVLVLLESEFVPSGVVEASSFYSCCKITHLFPLNHSNFRIFLLRFVKQVLNCWISAF